MNKSKYILSWLLLLKPNKDKRKLITEKSDTDIYGKGKQPSEHTKTVQVIKTTTLTPFQRLVFNTSNLYFAVHIIIYVKATSTVCSAYQYSITLKHTSHWREMHFYHCAALGGKKKSMKVSAIFISNILPILPLLKKRLCKLHVRSSTQKLPFVSEVTLEYRVEKGYNKRIFKAKSKSMFPW